ncbi:UDP-glycosyltransferase 92A1-like protein [Carex littledalei]|uniref:Glycosyltransferase n=1 Tax=Carex littledalei TaxID=544730 RepID=A0A833QGV8_9POAL|nr:UDP-glycosyltransferase 92A1-like protein [Carex littledalei]
MEETNSHVVLFPFPAHGHISPYLALATRLHQYQSDLIITVVSTPRNIDFIRSSLPISTSINLHSLPFSPADYGLPQSESTIDLLPHQFPIFFSATESLRPAFDEFIADISTRDSVCIISDMFFGWTVDVARKHKAFHSIFLGMTGFSGAVILSLWLNLPHNLTSSEQFSLPEYSEVIVNRSELPVYLLFANGKDPLSLFMQRQLSSFYKTDVIMLNAIKELDPSGLVMLRKTFKTLVLPMGPFLGAPNLSALPSGNDSQIIEWLDLLPPASVIYIAFGSQESINSKQMMELALALEESGRPFIWAIRPPIGFSVKDEFKDEWLPLGFKARTKKDNRGLFVHDWAPQVRILSHKSTGAFISHCGWNSVLESLYYGVPIIGWPLGADQPFNLRVLVQLGVCVKVVIRNKETSKVEKEKVKDIMEMVMGENEKAREIRKKTKEIRDVIRGTWKEEEGSSMKSFMEFLEVSKTGAK